MLDLKQYKYTGDTPKPVFNTTFYTGKDFYSDGDIEDNIIKLIAQNPTNDYEQTISENYSWPVFYHLTRIRQNILNWYPINNDSDVLEIGCGMGAITELLCKKAQSVTAVELSQKRATATYLRCRNYDNLEIIVGNLNDIQFNKKYDYITLIGVLEYQNNFTNSGNPFVDFLSKIRSLLKPNGKLLIAIENKYGVKYWCGATEDHSGIPFDGINNYRFSNIARTFSKKELNSLIHNSGFNYSYFYYPLPDYKMPQAIYSENYLPKNGSINNWIPYYSTNNKSMIADETHLYNDLVENNVFEFFANSFLVECSVNNNQLGEINYAVSSPFRNSKFDIITTHSTKNGFCKIATDNSLNFLHIIDNNHKAIASKGLNICKTTVNDNILSSETITGTPLTQLIINAYKTKCKDNVYDILDKIYEEIKKSSSSSDILNDVFNRTDELTLETLDNNDKILANGFIDMIHKNCFVDSTGNYIWIDQEWCFNNIPASYILFHNIVELYSSNSWFNSYIPITEIFEHYNLSNKANCYFNFKNVILTTVQNKYSVFNYRQLSDFDNKEINNNIVLLYNNVYGNKNNISQTEQEINNILKNGTIEELINYVNTLNDDIILKDIPNIPKFIVKYLNSDTTQQQQLNISVKQYQDISKIL
jgi:2-polyprenyl-3-methyl-5-hydroxy-6-metoxy-1,4-benzoquinol methylase